jgi:hypothetical protein
MLNWDNIIGYIRYMRYYRQDLCIIYKDKES